MSGGPTRRILTQPLVGIVVGGLGLAVLAALWAGDAPPAAWARPEAAWLTLALLLGFPLAYQFPVHIHYRLKVQLSTVPTVLLVALLPAAAAVAAVGAGTLIAELLVWRRRGSYPSDIATQTGRLMLAAAASGLIMGLPAPEGPGRLAQLAAAALALALLDALTLPLSLAPVTGEAPGAIIRIFVQQAGVAEGAQYLLAMLGALAAERQPAALLLLVVPIALIRYVFRQTRELQVGTRHLLESLADTVDLRDPYTGGHSVRVATLCAGILRELPLDGPDADLIVTAARVHDIGKIGVPDAVLNKPGPLTPQERAVMETHAPRGADLLARYPDFVRGAAIVRHHHEQWDGGGYPAGLHGEAIPLGARIIAVADSYDAMTSDRPYRSGMAPERARAILREGRARQWDAAVVDAFLRAVDSPQNEPALITGALTAAPSSAH